jgi:hypothetical protein
MPLTTFTELTPDQKSRGSIREDLLDTIENLSPKETPLFNNLGQIQVHAGYVEYLTDTLTAAAANAQIEGAAATDANQGNPTRAASHVQILRHQFWVSGRQQAVRHAGMASMLAYNEMKASARIKTDLELALHRGSAVTGNTNTAPNFSGMLNRISTYGTASSGTTLTERQLNEYLTSNFATPANLRELYANMLVKRTINGFTTNTQRFIPATDRRQVDIVEVYESEMGILGLFKSRYQLQAANFTSQGNSFIAIDPSFWKVGVLRPFRTIPLGADGDRDRRLLLGEYTLIAANELAGVAATGLVAYLP